jgi:ClpP class serine protease
MSKFKKLARRVLNTSDSASILSFIECEMSKPLLSHPDYMTAYARMFLNGNYASLLQNSDSNVQDDDVRDDATSVVVQHHADSRALVLNIDGALVAKEMDVPCLASPVSYEAIKHELIKGLKSPNIDTIIARFDSGGGVAAQNSDLSDFIRNQRGKGTKLIALVDDNCYSAAYAIASAFDTIVLSRTSGVGSVGVVLRHVSKAKANKKKGHEVTYLYAGDKKILGNSDEPLSRTATREIQEDIEMFYSLFISSVSKNLGLSTEVIKATQAGTFTGQKAIDMGFAHKIGNLENILNELKEINMDGKIITSADTALSLENETLKVENKKLKVDIESMKAIKFEQDELIARTYAEDVKALCKNSNVSEAIAESFIIAKMPLQNVKAVLVEASNNKTIINGFDNTILPKNKAQTASDVWANVT